MKPENLLEVLGNKYSVEILKATTKPRTAQELSDELNIPIATCYRRLEDLSKYGIVDEPGTRTTENNRTAKLYLRRVERIRLDLDDDISISLKERSEVDSKLDEVWQRLRQ